MPSLEEYRASAQYDLTLIKTIEIQHTDLTTQYFVNDYPVDGTFQAFDDVPTLRTFVKRNFNVRLADTNALGALTYTLALDDTDSAIHDTLEDVPNRDPITIVYREYLLNDTTPKRSITFYIEEISFSPRLATGTGTVQDIQNRNFPGNIFKYKKPEYAAL